MNQLPILTPVQCFFAFSIVWSFTLSSSPALCLCALHSIDFSISLTRVPLCLGLAVFFVLVEEGSISHSSRVVASLALHTFHPFSLSLLILLFREDEADELDEKELEKQDEFEALYNFRYEEEGGSKILTHARDVEGRKLW